MKEVRLNKQLEEKEAIIQMLKAKYEEDTGKALTIVKSKQNIGVLMTRYQVRHKLYKQAKDSRASHHCNTKISMQLHSSTK